MTTFARYSFGGTKGYGIVDGEFINRIKGLPYDDYEVTNETRPLSEVRLLAPIEPSKIIAIGLNYKSHLGDREPPSVPEPFLKTPSSIIGPNDSIIIPREALEENINIQEEAELTVVIGKRCKRVKKDDALNYVLGYTCGNDVSSRPWQRNDLQWWRAKSSDTFTAIGPVIVTDLDPFNLDIKARVNGNTAQDSNTSDLLYDLPTIIEFVTRAMTLEPGDVIMTGTPGEPVDIKAGDTVEIELEGVGVLRNPVENE